MLRKAETSTSLIERRFDLMQILTCLLFNTALTIQVEDSSDTKRQYYRIWILACFIRISVSCCVCSVCVFFLTNTTVKSYTGHAIVSKLHKLLPMLCLSMFTYLANVDLLFFFLLYS